MLHASAQYYTILYLSLLSISVLISGCPPQYPPEELPPVCNTLCEETYPLTTYVFGGEGELGNITVSPSGSSFSKGNKVYAWFESINPDYDFYMWTADPPDIYSTNNPFPLTIVQIKDQPQSLTALCRRNKVTLTVECDIGSFLMPGNRLEVPDGANVAYTIINGEQVPWRYTKEYPLGSLVEVSAIPANGYIIDWNRNPHCVGGCKGIIYNQNNVSVIMMGDVYLKPCATHINDYDFDFHTMTISAVNGGDRFRLLSAGYNYDQRGCDVPLFPCDFALSHSGRFTVAVIPGPFKYLVYWFCTSENLYCPYEVAEADFRYTENKTHSASAVLVDEVYLILSDPVGRKYIDHVNYISFPNKGGTAKIVCLSYTPSLFDEFPKGWNPVPFVSTQPNIFTSNENLSECKQCNEVTLEPIPCSGASFLFWEVSPDGEVWIPLPPDPINPNLTVYMNYLGPFDPTNYPYDIHVPNGKNTLYVRPVFKLGCSFYCMQCGGIDGRDVIIDMYENPDPDVKHPDGMYAGPAPDCDRYVTNQQGHPQSYTKENLLPFDKLRCKHESLPYNHDGWAIEDGIAECYHAVDQKYYQDYGGHVNITSVYRCPVKNSSVPNSSKTSKHILGRAFDFDQPSSEENWRVAKAAYDCNNEYEILLYYSKDGKERSVSFSDVSDETKNPWETFNFTHGHVGIN